MSLVAILNSKVSLDRMIAEGHVPAAVATWSGAVHAAAVEAGIPCILEDTLLSHADRAACHERADTLVRALCGSTVPASHDYADWCWWSLEFPLQFAFAHGARTLWLLKTLRQLVPDFILVAHDREGYLQGALVNFFAHAMGATPVSFDPHTAVRDTLHQRLDAFAVPLNRQTVRTGWQGKPMPRDGRPAIVMIHTNEVAHLVGHLTQLGHEHFVLCEDARYPWPKNYMGPRVDARATGETEGLVTPRWPEGLTVEFSAWERQIAESLAMTYQPSVREEYAWARAAYGAGRVRAVLGGGTWFHDVRARVLACRDLGIPVILVQHGLLAERPGCPGERVQHFADHQLEWSRQAGADIARWGASGQQHIVGWPQASSERAVNALAGRQGAPPFALGAGDPRPWVILTSSPLPEEAYGLGAQFLHDALDTIHAVDPGARVIVKHHPFQEPPEIVRQLCDAWGYPDVEITGGIDPWTACAPAKAVVAFKSTSVLCPVNLGIPVVVHQPAPHDAMFERFPGMPITRTREELHAVLTTGFAGADYAAVRAYARTNVHAGRRVVATLRRILHGRPAIRRQAELVPA
jgi:hypothetical protein